MTKNTDQIAIDAAKAAQLIKSTADATATALNIQYIQKDIQEIKDSIKGLVEASDGKIDALEKKIDALNRLVFIGVGIASTIAIAFPLMIKFFAK